MKKILAFCMSAIIAAVFLSGPMITKYAFSEGKYEQVTCTATASVPSTWTILDGSTLKFSDALIHERSGLLDLKLFGGGDTNNAAAAWTTIKAGTWWEEAQYHGTLGIPVSTTITGLTATVEFRSKRPASYWPWR